MRDLIDRQTTIEAIKAVCKPCADKTGRDLALNAIWAAPTVTRISDERYYRLIGKPTKP